MESWRLVWRNGFVPALSTPALEALKTALEMDVNELVQGKTTIPPPLYAVSDWIVEAACAIGYCGWRGERLNKVGEVEEYFARLCHEADMRIGGPGECRYFLNWFDETPREDMRKNLLDEVNFAIIAREA